MGDKTKIEWTDATWNPIRGCSPISPGCKNCYAARNARRFSGPGAPFEGLVRINATGEPTGEWNGQVRFVEKHLLDPLKWKAPRRIFVNSVSDLFHDNVTDEQRDRIFAVIFAANRHTFQVLTKRPKRMYEYFSPDNPRYTARKIVDAAHAMGIMGDSSLGVFDCDLHFPLMNVWLGTSAEDQQRADARIPWLLKTPTALRFVSCEPLLGPITLPYGSLNVGPGSSLHREQQGWCDRGLDWVICGGESGPGARPMHPEWARSLRDQCQAAAVPFFFKQWGEWLPERCDGAITEERGDVLNCSDEPWRVGKKLAGARIDGHEWKQFPEPRI